MKRRKLTLLKNKHATNNKKLKDVFPTTKILSFINLLKDT